MKQRFRRERSFGFLVGGTFVALGSWWVFRDKFRSVAPWALALGLALVVLGAAAPSWLVGPRRAWMALAEKIGWVMTRVILAVVYYIVLTPIGAIRRLTGADPLRRRRARSGSSWDPYPTRHLDPRHYEKSF